MVLLRCCGVVTNKNQHYVPKAHLMPFTLDGEGRAISLYNTDMREAVQTRLSAINAPATISMAGRGAG